MKKLYKSAKNRKIAGVCGGLSEYLNIDATVIRLIFVIVTLFWGFGLLAYIIAAIIMPESQNLDFYNNGNPKDDIDNLKSANLDGEEGSKQNHRAKKSAPHSDAEFDEFFSK